MNARYYDPVLVSFLSPDTVVPEPGQPEGYNRYAYANGNPLRFSDPSGHIPDEEICTLFEICGDGARLLFEKHFGASLTDLLFDTSTSWGDLSEWDSSKKAAMLVLLDLRDGGGGMGPALWGVMGSIAGKPVSFSQLDPAAAYDTTYIASIDSVDDLPIDWDYSSSYWPTTYVDISEWYLVSASSSVIGNGGQLLAGAATKLGLGGYAIKAAELLGQWGIPAVGLLSQAANLMDDFKLNPYGYQCSKTFCSAVTTYPAVRFRTDAPGWWYYSFMEPRARR